MTRDNFIPFEAMVENRKTEARKSIVVEVPKKEKLNRIQDLCLKFGTIKNMFEFEPSSTQRMIVIEYEKEESLNEIIEIAQHSSNGDIGSIQIPFLKLRKENGSRSSDYNNAELRSSIPVIPSSSKMSSDEAIEFMKNNCDTMSEQIQYFYEMQKMTEIDWRLRFLTCRKIEWVLPRMLSHLRVLPFGSSVNTFGNYSCDLDMVINFSTPSQVTNDFPLIIQPGKETNNARGSTQKNLALFADLMLFYMPGFNRVARILQAKVPIIKCNETFTGMECDISVGNLSGVYMSEMLYLYGCSDPRVRPLVFCVRWWAKRKRLTRKMQPGRWFSNFTTTLLVLFFLMNSRGTPVLLPLAALRNPSSGSSFPTGEGSCSIWRDISHLPPSDNSQNLQELLLEFFQFYSNFNFKQDGVSLVTGKAFPKPSYTALYIENPIEQNANVSKNVNLEELEIFKIECQLAASSFEEFLHKPKSLTDWGIVGLFETAEDRPKKLNPMFDIDLKSIIESSSEEKKKQPEGEASLNPPEVPSKKSKELTHIEVNSPIPQPKKKKKKRNKNSAQMRFPPTFKF